MGVVITADEKKYSAYQIKLMFEELFNEITDVCTQEQSDKIEEYMNIMLTDIK